MVKPGTSYESFVQTLIQAIVGAEEFAKQKNIKVEKNKKLKNRFNVEREFDIYWEYELAGVIYKTVIECKDYSSTIDIGKIDAFVGKLNEFPDIRGIFATTIGYQSGAKATADANKIDLLIIREQNNNDWTMPDGTPLIKKISMEIVALLSAYIVEFKPYIDGKWIKENTDIDITQHLRFSGMNNEIFIEDNENNKKYSLHKLAQMLQSPEGSSVKYGLFEKEEKFNNAFIYYSKDNLRLKLSAYYVKYLLSEPLRSTIEIDISKEVRGVVEYLSRGTKKMVLNNGAVKNL